MAPVHYRAVLCYDQRIVLDGALGEAVDTKAKELAAKRLAELTARKIARPVATTASEVMEPKSAPTPPAETPEQLRARVRASLLRPSAQPSLCGAGQIG
jgi:hypothetical protein